MKSRARFIVPEVVQTSNMDCGPAALKCLLGGFGIDVNYGRLREACQTDVDGTSIDTIEEVANQLGLQAEQIMLPADHVLLEEARALPAIAVVVLPNGLTHFVVVWRRHGRWLQVMDPATGRMLNADMEFYRLAGLNDIPELVVHMMTGKGYDERGVIGLGEPPVISPGAAISNAVANAIGVRVPFLPLTPDRVLIALEQKAGA